MYTAIVKPSKPIASIPCYYMVSQENQANQENAVYFITNMIVKTSEPTEMKVCVECQCDYVYLYIYIYRNLDFAGFAGFYIGYGDRIAYFRSACWVLHWLWYRYGILSLGLLDLQWLC